MERRSKGGRPTKSGHAAYSPEDIYSQPFQIQVALKKINERLGRMEECVKHPMIQVGPEFVPLQRTIDYDGVCLCGGPPSTGGYCTKCGRRSPA